ncbi:MULTISPECIES: hypothetical protein [unclassified Paenibacillus]|uniref:hypothetical protein n=1 Tax=unclassified Paenibacillus TaxID=185978 RepID=UPI0030F53454
MKQAISLIIVFPFLVYFMFQPFMNEVVHLRGVVLEQEAHKAAKYISTEGRLTPTIRNMILADLNSLHFDTSKLIINTNPSSGLVTRGNTITVNIQYPVGKQYIFVNWFGSDKEDLNYNFTVTEMSEYLP